MALRPVAHPVRRHRLRAFMASRSLWTMLLVLVAVLGVASLLLAIPFTIAAPDDERHSILFWWWQSLLVLLGSPPPEAARVEGTAIEITRSVAGLAAIVLPGLFLGAVVYKLFLTPDLFQFRNCVAIVRRPSGDTLVFRLYNTSRMTAVDLTFRVYLRAPEADAVGIRVPNRRLRSQEWPAATPGVPYSIRVRLDPGDIVETEDGPMLASIQGTPLPVEYTLLVTVRGAVPELGVQFNELAWFDQSDLSFAPYGDVQVAYGTDPGRWGGWKTFDAEV